MNKVFISQNINVITQVSLILQPLVGKINHPLSVFTRFTQYRQQILFDTPKCVEFIICFFKSTNFTLIFKL